MCIACFMYLPPNKRSCRGTLERFGIFKVEKELKITCNLKIGELQKNEKLEMKALVGSFVLFYNMKCFTSQCLFILCFSIFDFSMFDFPSTFNCSFLQLSFQSIICFPTLGYGFQSWKNK